MSYSKTTWQTGDTVTAELLNHMEDGISSADAKELPAVSGSDNGKVLTVTSGAWAAATPSGGGLPSMTSNDRYKSPVVGYAGGWQYNKRFIPLTTAIYWDTDLNAYNIYYGDPGLDALSGLDGTEMEYISSLVVETDTYDNDVYLVDYDIYPLTRLYHEAHDVGGYDDAIPFWEFSKVKIISGAPKLVTFTMHYDGYFEWDPNGWGFTRTETAL